MVARKGHLPISLRINIIKRMNESEESEDDEQVVNFFFVGQCVRMLSAILIIICSTLICRRRLQALFTIYRLRGLLKFVDVMYNSVLS